ncbi:hypothetical protein Tco_1379549 [Tanacetum coccineum]
MACNGTGGGGCESGGGCYKDNQEHKPPTTGDANNNHNQITCLKFLVAFSGDASPRFICTTNFDYFSHPPPPVPFQVIMDNLTSSGAVSSDNGWIYMIE